MTALTPAAEIATREKVGAELGILTENRFFNGTATMVIGPRTAAARRTTACAPAPELTRTSNASCAMGRSAGRLEWLPTRAWHARIRCMKAAAKVRGRSDRESLRDKVGSIGDVQSGCKSVLQQLSVVMPIRMVEARDERGEFLVDQEMKTHR